MVYISDNNSTCIILILIYNIGKSGAHKIITFKQSMWSKNYRYLRENK